MAWHNETQGTPDGFPSISLKGLGLWIMEVGGTWALQSPPGQGHAYPLRLPTTQLCSPLRHYRTRTDIPSNSLPSLKRVSLLPPRQLPL